MTTRARFAILASLLALATSGRLAEAAGDTPVPSQTRRGLTFGLSLGPGALSSDCDGCDTGAGVSVGMHVGWMLHHRFALVYDGSGVVHTDGFGATSNLVLALAGQVWIAPRLWLKAGGGLAEQNVAEGVFGQMQRSARGFGITAGAGFEVARAGRFLFDLEGRVATAFYDGERMTNASVLVGASFY